MRLKSNLEFERGFEKVEVISEMKLNLNGCCIFLGKLCCAFGVVLCERKSTVREFLSLSSCEPLSSVLRLWDIPAVLKSGKKGIWFLLIINK